MDLTSIRSSGRSADRIDAAIGELRCVYGANSTFLYGDQNGDGVADFMLALAGMMALAASDFIL